MAGDSSKEIKNRIRSMVSTKQITRAMEMVAASKLRRAQIQVLHSRPYFQSLHETINEIAASAKDFSSPYLQARLVKKVMYIVIAGDRGLAGGYNSNILKLAASQMKGKEIAVLPIGKKAVDFFRSRQIETLTESYGEAADVDVGDCFDLAEGLCNGYIAGKFDEVYVAYTNFASVLSQTPTCMKLLPLNADASAEQHHCDTVYEPDAQSVFAAIVPVYLGGILYGALCESLASEQAARRTAMDAATSNAEEMIADLSLKFNRARQAAITQEITEIVAGA